MESPKLTIVAVTYNHPIEVLKTFVSSLQRQDKKDGWICKIYHDGPCSDFDSFSDLLGIERDGRFIWEDTFRRTNDFGNSGRLRGLFETNTEWYTTTNCDNIYFPNFVEDILSVASGNPECDLVLTRIVHNYAFGSRYEVLNPQPIINYIDYMSFMIKTSLMKQIGFKDLTFRGQDGLIATEAVARGAKWVCTKSITGVHC